MKKSKVEIIQETVDYYSADPNTRRAKNEHGDCVYINSCDQMCAVGRCMVNPRLAEGIMASYQDMVSNLNTRGHQQVFKPEYEGHPAEFWQTLQNLHDFNFYWTDNGLSERGKIKVQDLIDKWTE